MADGTQITAGTGTTIATDDTTLGHHQKIKIVDGTADSTIAIPGDAANGLDVDVTRVQGTVTVAGNATVSGTVTSNIGTTGGLALDATLTGGTAKTKIVDSGGTTVATVTAANALKVDGSAVTQPVSGTVTTTPPSNASTNVAQFGGTNVVTGTGAGGAGIPRVTVSNDSTMTVTATQATGSNLHTVLDSGTLTSITNAVAEKNDVVAASTAAWTSATAVDTALSLAATNYATTLLSLNPSSTFTGGALNFEVSDDGGTTWYAVQGTRMDSFTSETTYTIVANTKRMWQFDTTAATNFRARLNPAITGTGTATLRVQASAGTTEPAVTVGGTVTTTPPSNASTNVAQFGGTNVSTGTGAGGAGIPRVTISNDSTMTVTANQGGTWTVQPGNTANTTPWLTTQTPGTSGGLSVSHLVSGASTNATNVKASAGQLFGWFIYNSNAAARKVAFHNSSGTPTAGASVLFSIVIPPTSAANVEFTNGIAFGTGIAFTTVTGLADSDATAVAANDLIINLFYK